MEDTISLPAPVASRSVQWHPVRLLLRLEGLAVAGVSLAVYARFGGSWALFAALWLAPDLSMLAYLRNANFGARVYNALHSYVTPATLGLVGFLLHAGLPVTISIIWVNHIGVDRLFGYGLKYPDGFFATHLGSVGRDTPGS